jgi:Family of unknown function (DUF6807)
MHFSHGLGALLGVALAIAAFPAARAANGDDSAVNLSIDGRPMLEYRYREVPFKPYARKLLSPSGVNVLRDAPHDHLHHHALMFAIAVDGVSFWQEQEAPGRQIHRSFADGDPDGRGFTERVDWLKPEGEEVVLRERRTLRVLPEEGGKVSLIAWESALELPKGKASAALTGSHYYGLGMRFVDSMDKGGTFLNADKAEGEVVRGTERVTPSKWCAYQAKADGHPVTVAMFDHPDNVRHPATWFTMTGPFAYMSATLNLWKEPMTLKSAEPMVLRYGVALWDGHVERDMIEELYKRWLGLMND